MLKEKLSISAIGVGQNIECFCSETKILCAAKLASDASDNIVSVGKNI